MSKPGTGAANDVRELEYIAAVERNWTRVLRGRANFPGFWPDAGVRRFLIAQHGFLTIDDARCQLIQRFGRERAPSRSAIGRFWKALDEFWRSRM